MGCTRLLLVDDSIDDARLFLRAVERSGLEVQVEWAGSAAEARYLISRAVPALVVLDNDMPETGGLELLREIRDRTAQGRVPIVMMSGTESDRDVELAYVHGVNSFVRKPQSYEDYLVCVQRLVGYWLETNCRAIAGGSWDRSAPAEAVGQCY